MKSCLCVVVVLSLVLFLHTCSAQLQQQQQRQQQQPLKQGSANIKGSNNANQRNGGSFSVSGNTMGKTGSKASTTSTASTTATTSKTKSSNTNAKSSSKSSSKSNNNSKNTKKNKSSISITPTTTITDHNTRRRLQANDMSTTEVLESAAIQTEAAMNTPFPLNSDSSQTSAAASGKNKNMKNKQNGATPMNSKMTQGGKTMKSTGGGGAAPNKNMKSMNNVGRSAMATGAASSSGSGGSNSMKTSSSSATNNPQTATDKAKAQKRSMNDLKRAAEKRSRKSSLDGKEGLRDYKTIKKRGFTIDYRDHTADEPISKFNAEVDKTFRR